MSNFSLSKSLKTKFDDAVAQLPGALSTEGFGILTQIDVSSVFAEKLKEPFRRYRIFGACNPKLAHRALTSNLLAGIMLPCNVILWENDDGTTTIATVDPVQTPAAKSDSAIGDLAVEVRSRLERVIGALT
jgi:uncharacterized protein (DUF302 family)